MLVLIVFVLITVVTAAVITFVQKIFAVKEDPIVEKIDALLPQTQCGQCGYPGCMPYAQALANGDEINKCVPGGQELVVKLAELLNREIPEGEMDAPVDKIAIIDESTCIGCLHCIEACPVDAIIGGKKLMHVIVPDYCTGCELCVNPCPVKCITMIDRPRSLYAYQNLARSANMPRSIKPEQIIPITNAPVANTADTAQATPLDLSSATPAPAPTQRASFSIRKKRLVEAGDTPAPVEQPLVDKNYSTSFVARLAEKLAQANSGAAQTHDASVKSDDNSPAASK